MVNLPCNAGDPGSILAHGTKIPHAEQLSLCFVTTEPEAQLESLWAARKIPRATAKTHNKYFFFFKECSFYAGITEAFYSQCPPPDLVGGHYSHAPQELRQPASATMCLKAFFGQRNLLSLTTSCAVSPLGAIFSHLGKS